jgi:serine/threonine protein kinase/formylglycine-generating enzyme required for sulfatase activity/pimeloyl-ACP methyl ester carboxylesterase
MDQERWRKVQRLFHAALEREPEARKAFLDVACGGDIGQRRQVELLLATEEKAGSFLETPAMGYTTVTQTVTVPLLGRQFGPYRIVSPLGAGGMGEVYRAHDSKLGRDVAIKTLPAAFARDPERLARFRREARTLASLNHPNIAAIYGTEESGDEDCLVLELVEGENLYGPLPIELALDYARQVADALEAAHEKGIIHRDLKPANVKVTPQGKVKVLDFGLAKAISGQESNPDLSQSLPGHIVGTPCYMSPEQVRGKDVDNRTDIWAFGCLLYELLTGKRGFEGETVSDTIAAVLEHEPDWQALPAKTPAKVLNLLRQCLRKDANLRLNNIADARVAIDRVQHGANRWAAQTRQPRFLIPATAILLLLGFLGVRIYQHSSRVRWVREQAIPEITRLFDAGEPRAAYRLIRRAEAVLPGDPALKQIRHDRAFPISLNTNPPGADVWAAEYSAENDDWLYLGKTPFTTNELPQGYYRLRIEKRGFQNILGAAGVPAAPLEFNLDAAGAIPPEMVRVPGGAVSISGLDEVKLGAFLIDRYEITNRQFKQFIERGGYRKREYWKQDLVQNGRKLPWEAAMRLFCDPTGRPGPSTWELGEYPQGQDDYPVNGVSWYEAAAYAEFAGKQLPTIYHWQQAASPGIFSDVIELSNFGSAGPARAGAYKGLGPFGTLDMAGNVKEWCWNEVGAQRYIRGGAWNEPAYMFSALDARSPWDRSAQNGIRCERHDQRAESGLQAPVTMPVRDYSREKPVSDEVFRLYRSLYAYDPSDLDSRVEGIDEENSYWKREKISFAAAYGNERVPGYLYIPKHATPPYQTIIYVAPSHALRFPSPQPMEEHIFEFIIKSGRAFLLPVVKGHYQRRHATPPAGPNAQRDRLVLESKDFRRSIDYLVSRPDVDRDRLGVLGISRGVLAPVLAVGEQRLKAAVLLGSGLDFDRRRLPEADPFNFLPRFRVPTLVVGGRFDFLFPLETSMRPMFQLLGAAEKDKQLLLRDGGHVPPDGQRMIKETLDWFDRYLGPVK